MYIPSIPVQQIFIPIKQCLESVTTISEALKYFDDNIDFLPVVEQNEIIGVVKYKVICEYVQAHWDWKYVPVDELMENKFKIVSPVTPIDDVLTSSDDTCIICCDENHLRGILYVNETLIKAFETFLNVKHKLEEIVDTVHDGIGVADRDGRIVLLNKSYERITGLTKEEAGLGRLLPDLVRENIISQSIAIEVFKNRKTSTIIQKIKSGVEVLATGTPVFDRNGEIIRVIANFRDLTDLNRLRKQIRYSKELTSRYRSELKALNTQDTLGVLNVRNPTMKKVIELVGRVATFDTAVLILGESGVGKEVIAKHIYKISNRSKGPFVHINCGAIPENLLESELFGYNPGAFSGANKEGKAGLFEIANHGIIFLDEIAELSPALQVKLLCFLQDHVIWRVGGTKALKLDVRIIAATNKLLQTLVRQGKFREDLYYRLNVVPIEIPPLRQRKEDILLLSQEFIKKFNEQYKTNKKISLKALQVFEGYDWPGNIRQLENLIERLIVTIEEETIQYHSVMDCLQINQPEVDGTLFGVEEIVVPNIMKLRKATDIVEKELVKRALEVYRTTREAASALGVTHTSIIRKVEKYNLDRDLVQYRRQKRIASNKM